MFLFDGVRHLLQRRAIWEYNAIVEKTIQQHWPDSPIKMRCLIWERWEALPEDGSNRENFNFVVFIDIEGDVDWLVDDDHAKVKFPDKATIPIDQAMALEASPCDHLPMPVRMAFKKMIGAAIVAALFGDEEAAREQTAKAKEYLDKRTPEQSRLWTLISSTVALPALCCLLRLTGMSGLQPLVYGAVGAYIAIAYRSSIEKRDAGAGLTLHVWEALVKLVAGMLQGKVCAVFMTSSLAPEFASRLAASPAVLAVIAFAAGLFDRFAPNLISNYVVKPFEVKSEEVS